MKSISTISIEFRRIKIRALLMEVEMRYRKTKIKRIVAICVIAMATFLGAHAPASADRPDSDTTNMISYWRFDEGSGTTAGDSINANHGTIYGATWTSGVVGSALSFDGMNDYVRIPDSDSLDITGDLTIEAWVKTTDTTHIIFSNMLEVSPHDGYSLRLSDGKIRFMSGGSLYSISRINTGTWKHIAVTLSGTTAIIYIDSVMDNYGTIDVPTANDVDQTIGASYTPYYFFNGVIDELAIYNRALTAKEIQQRYAQAFADCTKSQGFWKHQFSKKGKHQVEDTTLEAYLDIVNFTSAVFSEQVPASTIEEARDVMWASGPSMRDKAEAQILAAWLNFAQGSVAWDELIDTDDDGVDDTPFHQVTSEAETILLDADATHEELEHAKDLAEAVNLHDEDNPACTNG